MNIVVLISGSGSNLQAIIDACKARHIKGQVVGVLSNKADAYGLVRAQQAGIATSTIKILRVVPSLIKRCKKSLMRGSLMWWYLQALCGF